MQNGIRNNVIGVKIYVYCIIYKKKTPRIKRNK